MPTQNTNAQSPTSTTSSRTPLYAFVAGFALALTLSLVFLVPTARSEAGTEPPDVQQPSASAELVAVQFERTLYHQKRADLWTHRLGRHDDRAHKTLIPNLNLRFETKRTAFWKARADKAQAKVQAHKAMLRKCRQAGFPRWYCPILIEAATRRGVPHWSASPDLAFIIRRESGFNPRADNPTSTAYGLFQMLVETSSDPYRQTINGIRYIEGRYGNPARAVAFWNRHHWY